MGKVVKEIADSDSVYIRLMKPPQYTWMTDLVEVNDTESDSSFSLPPVSFKRNDTSTSLSPTPSSSLVPPTLSSLVPPLPHPHWYHPLCPLWCLPLLIGTTNSLILIGATHSLALIGATHSFFS